MSLSLCFLESLDLCPQEDLNSWGNRHLGEFVVGNVFDGFKNEISLNQCILGLE